MPRRLATDDTATPLLRALMTAHKLIRTTHQVDFSLFRGETASVGE